MEKIKYFYIKFSFFLFFSLVGLLDFDARAQPESSISEKKMTSDLDLSSQNVESLNYATEEYDWVSLEEHERRQSEFAQKSAEWDKKYHPDFVNSNKLSVAEQQTPLKPQEAAFKLPVAEQQTPLKPQEAAFARGNQKSRAESVDQGFACLMMATMAVSLGLRASDIANTEKSKKQSRESILQLINSTKYFPSDPQGDPADLGASSSAVLPLFDLQPSSSAVFPPGDPEASSSAVLPPGDLVASSSAVLPPGDLVASSSAVLPPGDLVASSLALIAGSQGSGQISENLEQEAATASDMPSEKEIMATLKPLERSFVRSNGGWKAVLQMLPDSPQVLANRLLKKGTTDYIQSLLPETDHPIFDKIFSILKTSGQAFPVVQARVGSEEHAFPLAAEGEKKEQIPVASGWDSRTYVHRAANGRDDIWHKNTEDNLFQIISKRISLSGLK